MTDSAEARPAGKAGQLAGGVQDWVERRRARLAELRLLEVRFLFLAAVTLVVSLSTFIVAPLLSLFAVSLNATPFQLSLLVSGFAVASAFAQIATGELVDRHGARSFLRGGIAVFGSANLLIASAADALALVAYRLLGGLGLGANFVATRVYVAQTADPARLAFVNGAIGSAQSVGMVLGPAVGGFVSAAFDLRAPFLLVGAAGVIALLISLWLPPVPRLAAGAAPNRPQGGIAPLNRAAFVVLAAQFCLFAWLGVFVTTYSPFVTQRLGWSLVQVGTLYSVFGLGSVLLGAWFSHLADRLGRLRVAQLCCLPLLLWIIGVVLGAPGVLLYPITLIAGGAYTAFLAALAAILTVAAPQARVGRTFGIVLGAGQFGTATGATLASAVWQQVDLQAALASACGLVVLAALVLLALPRGLDLPAPSAPTPPR